MPRPPAPVPGSTRGRGSLGTFAGVFTPSILTILGIILFLRVGWVVGQGGLSTTLAILAVATAISAATSVSLAAVATNLRVQAGGDYYLISRTLGVAFGGALGVVLFVAQSVSIAFYAIGFGEAVATLAGPAFAPRAVAVLAVVALLAFAWLGTDVATRFQYVVMAVLFAALAAFFAGGAARWDAALLAENWGGPADGPPFWALFAIFFPAVTGFTQGVSMSGELRDPGRSLPAGTFAAVGVSTAIYVAAVVVFAGALPGAVLRDDYTTMRRVASVAPLVDAGVIAATLSSAMASFLGAPRILQSLARDRVFRLLRPFAHGVGAQQNPRRAVLLAAVIALGTVAAGNLNLVARAVSMFFLISYGLLNYATFYEARTASPSFRPRFRWFDQRVSLAGAAACLATMLAIDAPAALVSVAVLAALHQYLQRTAGPARWADSSRSYHFQRLREHLYAMAREHEHPRDWRPLLLVFSNDSPRRAQLLRFASWLEGKSGITTAVQVVEGRGAVARRRAEQALAELRANIAETGAGAFPLVVVGPHLGTTASVLLQSFGIGPVTANTVLLNWIEQAPAAPPGAGLRRFGRHLRAAIRLGCNLVVLAAREGEWNRLAVLPSPRRRIDVWWWDDATSRLMLLLAYLVTRHDEWSEARIRVLAPAGAADAEAARARLVERLEEFRIRADVEVVTGATAAGLAERSRDAALVFVPLRLTDEGPRGPFGGPLAETLAQLPVTALVLGAEDIRLAAAPEEGRAAEIAAARDAAADAGARAEKATKRAERLARDAEEKQRALDACAPDAPAEERARLAAAAREATARAEDASWRAARSRARAAAAERAAEALEAAAGDRAGEPRTPAT